MFVLQAPRVSRVIFEYDGLAAPYGQYHPPLTTAGFTERARNQRQAFAALDRIERTARARGIDPAEIRQELKRVLGSKMGTAFDGMRADDLLELLGCPSPPTDRGSARSVIPSPPVERPTD